MSEKKPINEDTVKRTPSKPDLHERVRSSVGRGIEAFFETEENPDVETASDNVDELLASMLEEESRAAGDAWAEVGEGKARASAAEESVGEAKDAREPVHPAAWTGSEEEEAPSLDELYVPSEEEPPREETPADLIPESTPTSRPEPSPEPPTAGEAGPVDVTPPRVYPAGILIEAPVEVEVEPPGPHPEPGEEPEPAHIPSSLTRTEIIQHISQERFQQLEKEIDELYDLVPTILAGNKGYDKEALVILHDARQLLWTAPERLVDAEYKVKYVRALIERHRLSEEWGRKYGRRLLLYELAWLVVFLGGFLFVQLGQNYLTQWIQAWFGVSKINYTGILIPFLISLMWGGIGGVVGALYSLWWHVAQLQDFDRRYTMWYLVQPIMGFILGGIVYLIISTGFLALQGTVPTAESAIGVQLFPALVAVLGGFRQQFVYELLERIIRVLTPHTGEESTSGLEEAAG